jgi:hypothetical protein
MVIVTILQNNFNNSRNDIFCYGKVIYPRRGSCLPSNFLYVVAEQNIRDVHFVVL